jgi:hypothetical protein
VNQEDKMYNNVYVRRNIASDDDTPVEVLAALANDEDANVRSYVASNAADTPVEVLSALAHDADTDARASLADPDH